MTRWHYSGDLNLEYGGMFFDFSEMEHGYCTVVRVDDLDSAVGFTGAISIEKLVVYTGNKDNWARALSTTGCSLVGDSETISDNGHSMYIKGTLAWKLCLAYALVAYGSYDSEESETVQPDPTGAVQFDGWSAKRIRSNGLRTYVRRKFLGLRR